MKAHALSLGFDSVGVCAATEPPHYAAYERWIRAGGHSTMEYLARHLPQKRRPDELLPGAKSVIAVTLGYNRPNPRIPGRPRIARYALGRDYHKVMRGKLRKLGRWLDELHPESRSRACVDSAPILERDFAQLAGLGWYGKNTMLIDSKRGSWFFIGLLLTTAELEIDQPATGGCGTCMRCVEACPTGAIAFRDDRWQVIADQCISYLTIEHRGEIDASLQPKIGEWTFGCDVCQEVCPFNQPRESQPMRGRVTAVPDFITSREWPDLQALAQIEPDRWDRLTAGSAVRRAPLGQLRRNAAINLRNSSQS